MGEAILIIGGGVAGINAALNAAREAGGGRHAPAANTNKDAVTDRLIPASCQNWYLNFAVTARPGCEYRVRSRPSSGIPAMLEYSM